MSLNLQLEITTFVYNNDEVCTKLCMWGVNNMLMNKPRLLVVNLNMTFVIHGCVENLFTPDFASVV
jgi:hypothetical protein